MRCETPCTVANIFKEPWLQETTASPLGICGRKNEVLAIPAFVPCNPRVIKAKDSLSPCVSCERYRLYSVRDDIAIIAGDHNYFLITNVTNDEVVSGVRSAGVNISPTISPTSGKFNDEFWLSRDGLFGEAGRVDVDLV